MNRKGLFALGALATIGKIVAALGLAMLLARCSDHSNQAKPNLVPSEFDYSLGKSETQPKSHNNEYAPQTYNYGRNRR